MPLLEDCSNEELMAELLFNRWGIEKNGSTEDTPKRVVDAYQDELLRGMHIDPVEILKGATFEDDEYDQMICMDGIETFSLCVPSKELVNTVDGVKRACKLSEGDTLWTLHEGKRRQTTITELSSRKTQEVVTVETDQSKFKLTPDHPVMTKDGWVEAGNLEPGDQVEWTNPNTLTQDRYSVNHGESLGYVIGAIAADGSIQENRRISLRVTEREFAEKVAENLSEAFNGLDRPDVDEVMVKSGFREGEIPMYRTRVVSSFIGDRLAHWLGVEDNGSKGKTKKFSFPEVVLTDEDVFDGFLRGYVDGDGYRKNSTGSTIGSSNKEFMDQFSSLIGQELRRHSDTQNGTWYMYVPDQKVDEFKQRHGFSRSASDYNLVESEYATVQSVDHAPRTGKPHTVYTLNCEPYSTFLVRGNLVHNCEHHLLPFIGKTHVGYIPDGKVTGLSKIARTVNAFAARPQMQERLTEQVVDAVMGALEPQGAICVVKAQHFCMKMRGVEDSTSYTTTSAIRGRFEDSSVKGEFFDMLDRRRH